MSEQRCLDCGTHEAAGGYCTRCLGTNLEYFKPERSEAQKQALARSATKRAVASKKSPKLGVL